MLETLIERTLARVMPGASVGMVQTPTPGVRLFWSSKDSPPAPLVYDQGIVVIFQGQKTGFLDDRQFTYCPENYLVLTLPSPFVSATQASPETPLLGLFVQVLREDLAVLVSQLSEQGVEPDQSVVGPAAAPAPMLGCMRASASRLLAVLDDPVAARIVGPSLRREVLFHALRGPRGGALASLLSQTGGDGRLDRVVRCMRENMAKPISVEVLAQSAGMSPSAFHRTFRAKTGQPPLQYLKRMRLHTARSLIVFEGVRVSEAARRVGYESASQFSREYKRLFDEAPTASRANAADHPERYAEPLTIKA